MHRLATQSAVAGGPPGGQSAGGFQRSKITLCKLLLPLRRVLHCLHVCRSTINKRHHLPSPPRGAPVSPTLRCCEGCMVLQYAATALHSRRLLTPDTALLEADLEASRCAARRHSLAGPLLCAPLGVAKPTDDNPRDAGAHEMRCLFSRHGFWRHPPLLTAAALLVQSRT